MYKYIESDQQEIRAGLENYRSRRSRIICK
jgi:hypothetical protein